MHKWSLKSYCFFKVLTWHIFVYFFPKRTWLFALRTKIQGDAWKNFQVEIRITQLKCTYSFSSARFIEHCDHLKSAPQKRVQHRNYSFYFSVSLDTDDGLFLDLMRLIIKWSKLLVVLCIVMWRFWKLIFELEKESNWAFGLADCRGTFIFWLTRPRWLLKCLYN